MAVIHVKCNVGANIQLWAQITLGDLVYCSTVLVCVPLESVLDSPPVIRTAYSVLPFSAAERPLVLSVASANVQSLHRNYSAKLHLRLKFYTCPCASCALLYRSRRLWRPSQEYYASCFLAHFWRTTRRLQLVCCRASSSLVPARLSAPLRPTPRFARRDLRDAPTLRLHLAPRENYPAFGLIVSASYLGSLVRASRRYNRFVDDSAIESDGGGGNISSAISSREATPSATESDLDALIPRRPIASPKQDLTTSSLALRLLRSKPISAIVKPSIKSINKSTISPAVTTIAKPVVEPVIC
eukprot:IDg23616t1